MVNVAVAIADSWAPRTMKCGNDRDVLGGVADNLAHAGPLAFSGPKCSALDSVGEDTSNQDGQSTRFCGGEVHLEWISTAPWRLPSPLGTLAGRKVGTREASDR